MNDLHAMARFFFSSHLERCQKARVDECSQDLFRRVPVFENRQKLFLISGGAGTLGRDEIAEDLPNDGLPLGADAFQSGFRVLGNGSGHTSDLEIGFSGQELFLSVPLRPEP